MMFSQILLKRRTGTKGTPDSRRKFIHEEHEVSPRFLTTFNTSTEKFMQQAA
jgi:hypothetical protein